MMTNIHPQTIISAQGLDIGYPRTRNKGQNCLYEGLSFNLYRQELTCLLGANGAGKSTLLRTISALQDPLKGDVILQGKVLGQYKEQELSYLLGLVLTDKTSVGGLTVYELVSLGRYPYTGFFGKLSAEDHTVISSAMDDTGIAHKASSYVAELSDGERQKAMIAKVLAQQCDVILLDEPTAFLDVTSRIDIINLLHDLALKHNKAILLSTHDVELALMLADRIWLLSQMHGLQCGATEDILFSGEIAHFFNRNDITFDIQSGGFELNKPCSKNIFVQMPPDYGKWVRNFLQRNGYKLVDQKEQAMLDLHINSSNNITINILNQTFNFISFEELTVFLRKYA